MDKRTFFSEQNVQPDELNSMQTAIQTALSRSAYEASGYGVVYGMGLGPTSPAALAVKISKGVAYYNSLAPGVDDVGPDIKSDRITLAADVSKSLASDWMGVSTAVSAGQERWLAIVAVPERVNSDPRTDGSGTTVNFLNVEAGDVYVLPGIAASTGTASKVAANFVRTFGVRLGDILISNATATITDAASFNLDSREQISKLLHAVDDSKGNGAQCTLFWQSAQDIHTYVRAYSVRQVAGGPPPGVTVTINTRWDAAQKLWIGDDAGRPCMAWRLQTNGFMFTQRTQGLLAGWPDTADGRWSDVVNPGNTDSMLMSALGLRIFGNAKSALLGSNGVITAVGGVPGTDESSVTVLVGFQGQSGAGALTPIACFASFPRPFTSTDKFTVAVAATDYSEPGDPLANKIGPAQDLNVNTGVAFATVVCPYGVSVSFTPTVAETLTRFSRLVTVTRRST